MITSFVNAQRILQQRESGIPCKNVRAISLPKPLRHDNLDQPPRGVSGLRGRSGFSGRRGLNGVRCLNGRNGVNGFSVPEGDDPSSHATGFSCLSRKEPSCSGPSQARVEGEKRFSFELKATQLRSRSKIFSPSNQPT